MMMPVETDQKGAKKSGGPTNANKAPGNLDMANDKRKSLGGEQFEKMVMHTGKMPSMIQHAQED
jgi:hypothetical protein